VRWASTGRVRPFDQRAVELRAEPLTEHMLSRVLFPDARRVVGGRVRPAEVLGQGEAFIECEMVSESGRKVDTSGFDDRLPARGAGERLEEDVQEPNHEHRLVVAAEPEVRGQLLGHPGSAHVPDAVELAAQWLGDHDTLVEIPGSRYVVHECPSWLCAAWWFGPTMPHWLLPRRSEGTVKTRALARNVLYRVSVFEV
jgi:hypothetical protein